MKPKALLAGLLVLVTGCSSTPKAEDYAKRTPEMDIREYLNGHVEAFGVIRDRAGMVTDQFHVVLKCDWNRNDGTLNEHFVYTDGRKQKRVWHLHMTDDHHFTGTAADVVGTGQGEQYGNAVNLKYTLRVPYKDDTIDLAMDDWMWRMDEHTVINHTEMHKYGLKVGDLFLTFKKK